MDDAKPAHPTPRIDDEGTPATGRAYWRSLDDLADTPQFRTFLHKEFPGGTNELFDNTSRRHFLKVMSASLAMAGLTSCRWPKENILPFAKRPTGRIPGMPQHFATGYDLAGVGSGLLVESVDGRPIKVEGNPLHPQNRGASTIYEQNLLLEMYDPDRSRGVAQVKGGAFEDSTDEAFDKAFVPVAAECRQNGGRGLVVISELSSSPSIARMKRKFAAAMPQAKWFEYEVASDDNSREGARIAFGQPCRTLLRLDRASVVLSLEDDFVHGHPAALRYARDFTAARKPGEAKMNRLYVIEANYSLTGGMADHRHAVRSSQIGAVLARIVKKLGITVQGLSGATFEALAGESVSVTDEQLAHIVKDLAANRGSSVVTVGERQPAAVHAMAHALNAALGNVGKTVDYVDAPDATRPSCADAIRGAVAAMNGGATAVVILGGNPAFDAPADLDFAAALAKAKTSVHLSVYRNETSAACTWHVPRAHALEMWGDVRAFDGTYSVVQPMIEPLFGGRTPADVVAAMCGEDVTGMALVRATFDANHGGGSDEAWEKALHDGLVADSAAAPRAMTLNPATIANALASIAADKRPSGDVEVLLAVDPCVFDGRFANSGWLQELPEPVTKLTWDNAVLMSPATAEKLGATRYGGHVRITVDGRSIEQPAFKVPGIADGTVVVWLGQGRSAAGRVGNGPGANSYPIRTTKGLAVAGAAVAVAGGHTALVTTQDHHAMASDIGQEATDYREGLLVRQAGYDFYKEHPDFAKHMGPHVPESKLWDHPVDFTKHNRWGMSINLGSCTGCSACVIACQAENNIPVVGKEEVSVGREMHWLRVDRYYTQEVDDPGMAHQPIPCMQCENAPCEQVCPVAATVHSHDGLNDMVYNRCIGTRYCSNNCPYKVRRFNWFLNHKDQDEVEQMRHNPDVTLRSRGVMEKCTYCVQRINAVKIKAKNEKRSIADGEVQTACQQVCPTDAIVFGDLNDKDSQVAKAQADSLSYGLLDAIKTQPRTKYLAEVKNVAHGKLDSVAQHYSHGHGGGHGDDHGDGHGKGDGDKAGKDKASHGGGH